MTMSFAHQADFIVAAYAVTAFVVAALVAWILLDHAALRRVIDELVDRGVTRRSQRGNS